MTANKKVTNKQIKSEEYSKQKNILSLASIVHVYMLICLSKYTYNRRNQLHPWSVFEIIKHWFVISVCPKVFKDVRVSKSPKRTNENTI